MKIIEYTGELKSIHMSTPRDCMAISMSKTVYFELSKYGIMAKGEIGMAINYRPIVFSKEGAPIQFICHEVCPNCGAPIK